ncbi:uncharacterized protein LOC113756069 [Coffea eugenioides]|uniref:uncharacterized protein LOC113756069 n=1 Tax=Coffea eugenioides TaxID=49369 RepID=UPI000F60930D|nr:uncharacterized protein LOC113756069 [Coffea eugenioides]
MAGTSMEAGSNQRKQIWNALWRLNIKHKIKLFVWKCIRGAIPVREAIFKRTGEGDPVCKGCGEEPETIEHSLLQCPIAKAIWKIAPITWEGADDQIGNFHRWWSRITEAKNRQDGRNHMGLTANILWQIWKDRNKREFENQAGYNPCSVIQKAHMEWLEIVELDSKKEPQSTTETAVPVEVDSVAPDSHEGVNLRVAIKTSKRNAVLGIGVSVRRVPNEAQEVWALKDRSSGDHIIDEATAIKLTLCKALDRQWSTISVHIRNKGLLKLLKLGKASDCRMTTLIEDILSLKSLFRMCSFCLDNDDDNIDCNSVSSYAQGILLDEEFLVPPCS